MREVLLLQKGNIDQVVDCYLQDQPRRPQVFPFLMSVLAPQDLVDPEKRKLLLDAVKKNIKVFFALIRCLHSVFVGFLISTNGRLTVILLCRSWLN